MQESIPERRINNIIKQIDEGQFAWGKDRYNNQVLMKAFSQNRLKSIIENLSEIKVDILKYEQKIKENRNTLIEYNKVKGYLLKMDKSQYISQNPYYHPAPIKKMIELYQEYGQVKKYLMKMAKFQKIQRNTYMPKPVQNIIPYYREYQEVKKYLAKMEKSEKIQQNVFSLPKPIQGIVSSYQQYEKVKGFLNKIKKAEKITQDLYFVPETAKEFVKFYKNIYDTPQMKEIIKYDPLNDFWSRMQLSIKESFGLDQRILTLYGQFEKDCPRMWKKQMRGYKETKKYETLKTNQEYKPVHQKFKKIFNQLEQLASISQQFYSFFTPNYKNEPKTLSDSFSKILETARLTVSGKIEQISKQMEFKHEPEISLNSFFDIFGKYRDHCNWNYQKAIQAKEEEQNTNQGNPVKQEKQFQIINKSSGQIEEKNILQDIRFMNKQVFKKCAKYPIDESLTISERAVARMFGKLRILLNIPETPNIYEYLSELKNNFKSQGDTQIYQSLDSSPKIVDYNKNKQESLDLITKLEERQKILMAALKNIGEVINTADNEQNIIQEIQAMKSQIDKDNDFVSNLYKKIGQQNQSSLSEQCRNIQIKISGNIRANVRCSSGFQQSNQKKKFIELWAYDRLLSFADHSNILTTTKDKYHFYQTIEKQVGQKIKGFRLLYRSSPANRPLIQLKDRLIGHIYTLFLVETVDKLNIKAVTGYFGSNGYSTTEVEPYQKINFLISNRSQKVFSPYQGKALVHRFKDDSLIIGECDLLIDEKNFTLQSNFENSNTFNKGQNDGLYDLFGSTERERKIVSIEVFRVRFQNEQIYKSHLNPVKAKSMNELKSENANLLSQLSNLKQSIKCKLLESVSAKDKLKQQIDKVRQDIQEGKIYNKFDQIKKQLEEKVREFATQLSLEFKKNIQISESEQNELNKLTSKIKTLEEQNKQLKQDKSKYAKIIKKMKESNPQQQTSESVDLESGKIIQELQKKLEDLESKYEKLKSEKEELQKQRITSESLYKQQERAKLVDELQCLRARVNDLQSREKEIQKKQEGMLLQLRQAQSKAGEERKALEIISSQKDRQIQQLKNENQGLKSSIQQNTLSTQEETQNKKQIKLEISQRSYLSISKKLGVVQMEGLSISQNSTPEKIYEETDKDLLQKECKELQIKKRGLQFEINDKGNKISSLNSAKFALEKELAEKRGQESNIKQDITKIKTEFVDLERKRQSEEIKLKEIKDEYTKMSDSITNLKSQIENLENKKLETKKLIGQRQELSKEISKLSEEKTAINENVKTETQNLQKLKKEKEIKQKQLTELEKKKNEYQQKGISENSEIKQKQEEESQSTNQPTVQPPQQEQIFADRQECKKIQEQIHILHLSIKTLQEKKQNLIKEIAELQEKVKASQQQIQQLQEAKTQLESQKSKQQEQKKTLEKQIEDLGTKYEELMDQITQLQAKANTLRIRRDRSDDDRLSKRMASGNKEDTATTKMKIELEHKNNQITKLKQRLASKEQIQREQKQKIQKLKEKLKEMQLENLNRQSDKTNRPDRDKFAMIQKSRRQQANQVDKKSKKLKTSQFKFIHIEKPENIIEYPKYQVSSPETVQRFFNGKIKLQFTQKQFIQAEVLKQFSKNRRSQKYYIKGSDLLFFYPEMNSINFHDLVDNRNNLLIIIQFKDPSKIIAFYSEPILSKNSDNSQESGSFLAVLDEGSYQVFYLNKKNPQAKPLVYNDYYLVIGNSELRIKRGENKAESNIPTNFQYIDTREERSPEFMFGKKGTREALIERYQIYQLEMERKPQNL